MLGRFPPQSRLSRPSSIVDRHGKGTGVRWSPPRIVFFPSETELLTNAAEPRTKGSGGRKGGGGGARTRRRPPPRRTVLWRINPRSKGAGRVSLSAPLAHDKCLVRKPLIVAGEHQRESWRMAEQRRSVSTTMDDQRSFRGTSSGRDTLGPEPK